MNITFETELEDAGRRLAEVSELPGVMAYGATKPEAIAGAEALALRVQAERFGHGENGHMGLRIVIAAKSSLTSQI